MVQPETPKGTDAVPANAERSPLDLIDNSLQASVDWLQQYQPRLRLREQGTLQSIGDGIAWIKGLPSAAIDDVVTFSDGSQGLVFDLNEQRIGAILLHQQPSLTAGAQVSLDPRGLSVPVGEDVLGRVIDPLGTPLDGGPALRADARAPLWRDSPALIARAPVEQPLYTGLRSVDTLIPIGRGQRQLIIGDEGTGRTSLAMDTVIRQRGEGVRCIYVLIGQKRALVVQVIDILRRLGALDYTTIVVAEGSSLPGLQYLAPFAGSAIAAHWMWSGQHCLVVYDDLSAHARTYRELTLLLRRPPGREAYPGDIFSLHARLLEQATCLQAKHGGGSMTALPIAETQQGEIAAYIPTNLISITDGQIYLDRTLSAAGFRPAIDIGRSVSRIGGNAQQAPIRRESGRIKLDYLRFLELEAFTRFGAKLEASMELILKRGMILRELLKQERFEPLTPEQHLAWLLAFNEHWLDEVAPSAIAKLIPQLASLVETAELQLSSERERWVQALQTPIQALFAEPDKTPATTPQASTTMATVSPNAGTSGP